MQYPLEILHLSGQVQSLPGYQAPWSVLLWNRMAERTASVSEEKSVICRGRRLSQITDLGFDNSWYHAQPHPIIVYCTYPLYKDNERLILAPGSKGHKNLTILLRTSTFIMWFRCSLFGSKIHIRYVAEMYYEAIHFLILCITFKCKN